MKAVIPAAGLGTRFLPYTKSQPKEMLPILDKPAIQYVVEEALSSGIRELVIVTARGKRAIEDHFDANPELERRMRNRGRSSGLAELSRLLSRIHMEYVRQPAPLGNGHAVLCARPAIGPAPFAVLLGDDITIAKPPCIAVLRRYNRKMGASCIAVQKVSRNRVGAYGMVVGEQVATDLYKVEDVVEKPRPSQITSTLVTIGRYVFSPCIFEHLERLHPGHGGEIWLTDAIRSMLREEDVYAWVFDGERYDVGTKEGWLATNLELALRHPAYRDQVRRFIDRRRQGRVARSV